MKMINIGVVNWVVSKTLNESYFNGSLIESKSVASDLLNTIKSSPILQLEFKVFDNIENKYIESDVLAPRYIDKNIQLFEVYTLDELNKEHEKLLSFVNEDINIESDKIKLYNSIQTLIEESLKISDEVDVDILHESFSIVLDHIKTPKEVKNTEIPETINEHVIEIAINKFNEKYESMTSEEVDLFKKLIESNNSEKEILFEEFKEDNLNLLNALKEENNIDKINKSLEKINEMKFDPSDCDASIISLFELKRGLQ